MGIDDPQRDSHDRVIFHHHEPPQRGFDPLQRLEPKESPVDLELCFSIEWKVSGPGSLAESPPRKNDLRLWLESMDQSAPQPSVTLMPSEVFVSPPLCRGGFYLCRTHDYDPASATLAEIQASMSLSIQATALGPIFTGFGKRPSAISL